jgi:ketosteroid isomerase-like protein
MTMTMLNEPTARSIVGESICGYESDTTEVTSNTNPGQNDTFVNNAGRSVSTKNSGRWSSGDPVPNEKSSKPCKDSPMALMKAMRYVRRRGDSVCPDAVDEQDHEAAFDSRPLETTTSAAASTYADESRPDGLAIAIPAAEDDGDIPEDNEDIPLDLMSKPGIIRFEREEMSLADETDVEENSTGAKSHSSKTIKSTTSSTKSISLTEEKVRAHMKDYYEDFDSIFRHGKSSLPIWESFFQQYYTEDILWVRPSSNLLQGKDLAHQFANDIEGISMQLVSIDSIQLLGQSAVVVFTADQRLKYRGHPVNDRAVLTMVLHASIEDGQERIRIAHEHRCVGKPIPDKDSRWES